VYPNPLVADLMASGIATRIALLYEHHLEPNAAMQDAFARLARELDELAAEVKVSIAFLEAASFDRFAVGRSERRSARG
jgi:hypothetical protein